jgi:hypothetical protein
MGSVVNFCYRQQGDADAFAHLCQAHIFRITLRKGNSASLDGAIRAAASAGLILHCQPIACHWLWNVRPEAPNMAG